MAEVRFDEIRDTLKRFDPDIMTRSTNDAFDSITTIFLAGDCLPDEWNENRCNMEAQNMDLDKLPFDEFLTFMEILIKYRKEEKS